MKCRIAIFVSALLFLLIAFSCPSEARRGFSIGVGPIGNIFLIDTAPVMDPGIGGYTYFQYRYADQFAFQASFFISHQNGTNVNAGDGSILLLGMPTLDLKYFLLSGDRRFDPFLGLGTGLFILTEGTIGNGTGGVGVGTNLLVGFDFYLAQQVSLGFEGVFRVIGIISDFGTPSSSTAIFPYSLMANVAFHF